jgi:glucokinase
MTAAWLANQGVTIKRIFDAYDSDEHARAVIEETVQVIGLAAANLVTTLNPDAVILGGHVTESGAGLPAMVRAKIRQYGFDAAARHVTVAAAQLGADAGVIGAAVLAARHA